MKAEKIPHSYNVGKYKISDDYFWLRDDNVPNIKNGKILNYLESENKYAEETLFLKYKEIKERLFEELKARIKLTDTSCYTKKDNYYYYFRTEEEKNYKIYCRKYGLEGEEEVILDENLIAYGKNFMKISTLANSYDHKLLAYSVDFVGNERYTIRVLSLETKQHLNDEVPNVLSNIVWHKNIQGFFYTPCSSRWIPEKVMFHELGSDYKNDKLIYFEKDQEFSPEVTISSDKNFLFIDTSAKNSNEIYFIDLNNDSLEPRFVQKRRDNILYSIEHHKDNFYILTNDKGNNFRLVKTGTKNTSETYWQEVVALDEKKYLKSIAVSNSFLILNYVVKGLPSIEVIDFKTNEKNIVTFPDESYTANCYTSNFDENDVRIDYSSLRMPNTTYKYNFFDDDLIVLKKQEIPSGFNSDSYVVERRWADNKGVKVPISLLYKKALFKNDGTNPLYLYGYGAYGMGVPPLFRSSVISLVDRGFVFAIAHIRGGDELGFDWYTDGKLLKKKNTFEDFIACSEYLIDSKYTNKGNIIISGGSAGGLLIGYVINERPDLYKAAVMHVPFVDALNTMLDDSLPLTINEYQEWGNINEKEVFYYIKSYSPYDNIKKQNYPHIFISTSIGDTRVMYWEPAKFVAKLREYKTDNNDLFLKINMSAGHAGASGRFDYLKEVADDYVFILKMFAII